MHVPYAKAVFGAAEREAVQRVLTERPHLLMTGPDVADFEGRVAAIMGKRHGVMVNSGSSANTLAVASADLPRQSEVITPALTFATTVSPLVQHDLIPAFVDVEEDTFNIDASLIGEMITERTSAVMIPNLIGNLPDWEAVHSIARRNGLAVIEDSCDTLGATVDSQPTGVFSDITTTSFYGSHIITAGGFGGMLATDDDHTAERARLLRGWGRSSSLIGETESVDQRFASVVDGLDYDAKFEFSAIGYNFLPSEMSAAFGLAQLDRLDGFIERRIRNFAALTRFFSGFEEWFILPRQAENVRTGWLAFPLIVRDEAPFTRRELQEHFEGDTIQTRVIFTGNITRQPGFADIPRRDHPQGYGNADRVMRGGVLIGCHQGMGDEEVAYVQESFGAFADRVAR